MVVDDEPANVLIVTRLLERHGYRRISGFTDPLAALDAFDAEQPDLVVLDLHMPRLDGYGVMAALDERVPEGSYLPVLVLTADVTPEARTRSFRSGARDFMTKPTDAVELGFRVASLLETRLLNLRLQDAVRAQPTLARPTLATLPPPPPAFPAPVAGTAPTPVTGAPVAPVSPADATVLPDAVGAELDRLMRALAVVDDEPADVNRRVGDLAGALAAAAGCSPVFVAQLERAATLHDVGKVAVPQYLLQKHGELTADERRLVESHTERGAAFLAEVPQHPVVGLAAVVCLTHHERWDGSGFPAGLIGEQIPLAGRIVAVADAYASAARLAADGSWGARTALGRLRAGAGAVFDPALVETFVSMMEARAREARAAG